MPHLSREQVFGLLTSDGFGPQSFPREVIDEDAAFDFARYSRLINLDDVPNCGDCGDVKILLSTPLRKCRFQWICQRPCRSRVSVLNNTIFEGSKKLYRECFDLMVTWFFEVPVTSTAGQLKVSNECAISWFSMCRKICDRITTTENISIGGPGMTCEIDESHLSHRKYRRGRILAAEHVWMFGGICRETKEGFLQVVPDRKGSTLLPIIQEKIHPDSVIMHDGARVYNNLHSDQNGCFDHHEINHSQNFVDPNDPNIHTKTMERRWGVVKGKIKGFPGEGKIDIYLGEFLYREHYLKAKSDRERRNRGTQFHIFLMDAAKLFPGYSNIGI